MSYLVLVLDPLLLAHAGHPRLAFGSFAAQNISFAASARLVFLNENFLFGLVRFFILLPRDTVANAKIFAQRIATVGDESFAAIAVLEHCVEYVLSCFFSPLVAFGILPHMRIFCFIIVFFVKMVVSRVVFSHVAVGVVIGAVPHKLLVDEFLFV